jgi:GTP cyclohydrolase I
MTLSNEAQAVQQALIENKLENPMQSNGLSPAEKHDQIEQSMTQLMSALGLDLSNDSLKDTPKRIARMYLNEVFSGLDYHNFPNITSIDNSMRLDEMIKVDRIELISTCEHHLVTIDGWAKVAYVPRSKVIGLSKINRLVKFFAQRPQVQERLTRQIMIALQTLLDTPDVAVQIQATHYCVKARGVQDASSLTTTQAMSGMFKTELCLRKEFFQPAL